MRRTRLLLDTHVLLWTFYAPVKLSNAARAAILDADELFVSIITLWEIGIKFSRGGFGDLPIPEDWERPLVQEMKAQSCHVLPVEIHHCRQVQNLPFHHKDPFDRMIIAQAMSEGLDMISADATSDAYGVPRVW